MALSNPGIALAIDTSTRYALVGISRDGQSLAELSWRSERNHSVELVPAVHRVLTQARLELHDVAAIYLAIGPGGFSALRVGMSTAMAMAMARDVPVVTMGTLDVEAYPYLGLGMDVTALIAAGRSRLYVGSFKSDEPLSNGNLFLVEREEFFSALPAEAVFCGEAVAEISGELRNRIGDNCKMAADPPPTRSAGVMAEIGFAKLLSGDTADLGDFEPVYLRSSQVASASRRWPGVARD